MSEHPWQFWIDTGGTFTDVVAHRGSGPFHRAKVLSSGALRGVITRIIDERHIVANQNWNACDNLIAGFDLTVLGLAYTASVASFEAAASIIALADSLPRDMEPGATFEVRSDEPAPTLAARLLTRTPADAALPEIHMRLATTRGTNALLERRGEPPVLFITRGFGDLLHIGDQQRPDLFALHIQKLAPLHGPVVEVIERCSAAGVIIQPIDLDSALTAAKQALARGSRTAAIAFMHSHVNPTHERMLGEQLRAIGFEHIAMSADISPLIRLVPRAQTAVTEAYLAPAIRTYLSSISGQLRRSHANSRMHVMTSAGGLVSEQHYRACDSLLSGPAGGIAGAAEAARHSGFTHIIAFDMGGTSTDVARYDGQFEYQFEHTVEGVRLMRPSLAIESVAAGGGSICEVVDERPAVGPRSAGANPGPACYGFAADDAPLTITDVNLLLGRLDPQHFEIPIAVGPARAAADRVLKQWPTAHHNHDALVHGFLEIANERMAAAIERISVRQGYDVRDYALVAFGGAGGQHACAVAQRLGIRTVIMPRDASLLSAIGLGSARIERIAQRQVLQTLDQCGGSLRSIINELKSEAISSVCTEGVLHEAIEVQRIIANLRMLGQDSTLAIDLREPVEAITVQVLTELFHESYCSVYGHNPSTGEHSTPIELESIRVIAAQRQNRLNHAAPASSVAPPPRDVQPDRSNRAYFNGEWIDAPVFDRSALMMNDTIRGPALVVDRRSTCVIEPQWSATLDQAGALVARYVGEAKDHPSRLIDKENDPIQLELFSNRLASIAEEMGHMLQRTALSTNVKERLDFSCTILDANGELLVNAPHLPVHLGAMGMCVRAVRNAVSMREGDVIVTNHPAFGGSHLPDLTVITPVFVKGELLAYVANRAHHAEIGGTRPGSMPPNATTLAEEGVVIAPRHLMANGQSHFDALEQLLREAPHPSRSPADNLADLHAAAAANHRGVVALQSLAKQFEKERMQTLMASISARAERTARMAIARLPLKQYDAIERLDDGSPIQVCIRITHDRASFDFTGTAPTHSGNLNTTPAVVRSAIMYIMRLMIGERLPLNEGIMRAIDVHIPENCMLNPAFDSDPARCPAVVGGNTETSQRLVDTLLKALQLSACSQGTMNNLLFGNQRFGYYETVCGGTGAGRGFNGASAVHSHMTNTRITDPEILEHRYPVRVERFAIRRHSGGNGEWRGGDGAVRELAFLENVQLSILSQHRTTPPFGMHGGEPGATGTQHVLRADGDIVHLRSVDGCEIHPGDRLILNTPGGGGWGHA